MSVLDPLAGILTSRLVVTDHIFLRMFSHGRHASGSRPRVRSFIPLTWFNVRRDEAETRSRGVKTTMQ